MKLFESAWRDGFDFFARFYDTDLGKSRHEKINSNYEWFEEDVKGIYSYLLDKNIKLSKKQGQAKNGRNQYGFTDPISRYIRDDYWKQKHFNLNPRIWYLDIETRTNTVSQGFPEPSEAVEPVSLIQVFDNVLNTMIIFGLRDWESRADYKLEYNVKYIKCADEVELFKSFKKLMSKLDPLLIYAWNGDNFDFPYLYNRAKNLGLSLFDERGSVEMRTTKDERGMMLFKVYAPGYFLIDLMDIYKKLVLKPRTSYSLDNISRVELNDSKIQHDEFLDFDSFYTGKNYHISENAYEDTVREEIRQLQIRKSKGEKVDDELEKLISFQFVYYGIYDVYLLKKLDDKLKLSHIMLNMAALMGSQYSDMLGTVKKWATYISNMAYTEKLIAPIKTEHTDPYIVGGFVRPPVVGKHRWVMSADADSMYPLLSIAAYNMSPETFIPVAKLPSDLREYILKYFNDQDEDKRSELSEEVWTEIKKLLAKYNYSLAINGAVFTKDFKGIIPELVENIYGDRKKAKKTMLRYHSVKANIETYINNHSLFPEMSSEKIKDPLEYNDVYENISLSDLHELINVCEKQGTLFEVEQMTLKILINSLYGALGNKQFLFFNERIAQAITGNGRFFIKMLADNIELNLQQIKPYNGKYMLYGDTDSCVGSTKITLKDETMTIADLYDNMTGVIEVRGKDNFIKHVNTEKYALSVNSNFELEHKPIKYVMKHKVSKRMFKIKVNGNELIVTEDHSIMVKRDNKLISCKPYEIKENDELMYINDL